jgi:hypothetical protein
MRRCDLVDPLTSWDDVLAGGLHQWRKNNLNGNIYMMVYGSTVYNISQNRYKTKHGSQPKTEEQVMQKIIWEVRTTQNMGICCNWGTTKSNGSTLFVEVACKHLTHSFKISIC